MTSGADPAHERSSWWSPRLPYLALAVGTIAVGLLVHRGGLPLGTVARDVLGDALWAAMLAWWVGALAPGARLPVRSAWALAVCAGVELGQLLHAPPLDAVRRTTLGHLVLGSGFDPRDLAAYAAGVAAAALLERAVARRRRRPRAARTLRLVAYDAAWPARFEAEAERLRAALGDAAVAIEHVGSTAVPGLAGKPVLDVAIAVASEAAADACIAPLEGLGYAYRGPHGDDPRRRYYVRAEGGVRVAQLQLYVLPASAWNDHLLLRDALRADRALAAAYAAEKRRVAEAVAWDKTAYALAKGPFVARVLAALRAPRRPDPIARAPD